MSLVYLNQFKMSNGDLFFESSVSCYKTEYDVVEAFVESEMPSPHYVYMRSLIINTASGETKWKGDIHTHPSYSEIYYIREQKIAGEYVPEREHDNLCSAQYGLR